MTCDCIRLLLSGYHDDALSPEDRARVRAHLASCRDCAAILAAYEAVYRALQTAPTPVPPELRRRVYAQIAALEARQGSAMPFGPTLLGMLRSVGGTAGLLAVLAALVAAVLRLGSPQPSTGPAVASAQEVAAANTAVSGMLGAPSQVTHSRLPASAQTAVAALQPGRKTGAAWKVSQARASGSTVRVVGQALLRAASGAPRAVIPMTADVDIKAQTPVVQGLTMGMPSPVPTIAPGDGLVYLHLDNDHPFIANAGNAPAEVEWHPLASGNGWRVLVTPQAATQLFTGLNTSLDGNTVAYAAMGRGGYGGIFSFSARNPQPRQVVNISDVNPPNAGRAHYYVQQVYPAADGRLLFNLIDDRALAASATVAMTTATGATAIAPVGNPWLGYDYVVSPDRRHMIWTQGPFHKAGVWEYGTLQAVTFGSPAVKRTIGMGAHPVWSPDGGSILYWGPQPCGLYVWSARSGQSKRVAALPPAGGSFVTGMAWAPNSRFFAYVVSRPGDTSAVWLGDAQTGYTWKAFERPFIGAIAWVHGPIPTVSAPVATLAPVSIAVQSGTAQAAVRAGGTAQVPYGSGVVYVLLGFAAPVDPQSVAVRAGAPGWSLQAGSPTGGNSYSFALRGTAPGTVRVTLAGARSVDNKPLLAGPISFRVQAFPPPLALPARFDSTASPDDVLRSFYNAINRREYARAYGYLAATDKRTLADFARGYADTEADTIITLKPAPYQSASSFHATTCVGIQFTARHWNGQTVDYGGWYQVTSTSGQNPRFTGWRIVVARPHTRILPGWTATIPSQGACLAAPAGVAAKP